MSDMRQRTDRAGHMVAGAWPAFIKIKTRAVAMGDLSEAFTLKDETASRASA